MNTMIRKRRAFTLIEIMVVIVLIGLIMGVIGFNYIGTLEKGKAFKTEAGIEKLETILSMELAQNPERANEIETAWQSIVRESPMVKKADALIRDGWGQVYQVTLEEGMVVVRSARLQEYRRGE